MSIVSEVTKDGTTGSGATRDGAIARVADYFDSGTFKSDLADLVAFETESQNPARAGALSDYLESEMAESLERLGFSCRILPNPSAKYGPFLVAERIVRRVRRRRKRLPGRERAPKHPAPPKRKRRQRPASRPSSA